MRAKIVGVPTNYVNAGDSTDHTRVVEGTWSVELVVTDAEESKDQILNWYRDGVEFRLVPEGDAVPVVRMGGLSPAFYPADDDDEPDAYLVPAPEEL